MTVGRGPLEDRLAEVKVTNDGSRTEVEHVVHRGSDLLGRDRVGTKGLDEQRDGPGNADGVGDLHLAALGGARRDDVLGNPPGGIGRGTVDLRRVLPGERTATMSGGAAVGVDDDLAAGEAGVAVGAADDEVAGRIGEELVGVVGELGRDNRFDDAFEQVDVKLVLEVDARGVLSGDEHGAQSNGPSVLVVERDLRLAIGTQVRNGAVLADLGELLGHTVRQPDRQGHEIGRLVARVAEHHSLVAGALAVQFGVDVVLGAHLEGLVDPHGDVGRLLVDRDDHAAGVAVEALAGVVVADLVDGRASELGDVDVGRGGDLTCHDDEPRGEQGLASHPGHRVGGDDGIEYGVGNLVGHLVRVTLGHRLRCERPLGHGEPLFGDVAVPRARWWYPEERRKR